jgi:hypothetical protein
MRTVTRPFPSGVVILEAGIDEKGQAVSACVLRGIRSDVDKAAQFARSEKSGDHDRTADQPGGLTARRSAASRPGRLMRLSLATGADLRLERRVRQAARATNRSGGVENSPQSLVHGNGRRERCGHIRLDENDVRAFTKPLDVLAPDAALH